MIAIDHQADIDQYIRGVQDGTIVVGRYVRLAVRRHVEDLAASESDFEFPYYHDAECGLHAIRFVELCPHTLGEWAGQPLRLQGWQKFILWCLFGWRRRDDSMRRFRKGYIEVGRKNGKSTLMAAVGLLLSCADQPYEGGPEVYVLATKEKQARIIHNEAKRMVRRAPYLNKRAQVTMSAIMFPHCDGTFQPLGTDSDQSGFNPHAVLKDELHGWRERHRETHDQMSTGGASRRHPLELIITTAGDDDSVLWQEERELAERCVESVLTGTVVSHTLFSFVCCLDKEDDVFDSSNWVKANPNLGVSCKLDYLREKAADAEAQPSAKNRFLRYHCCLQTGSTERAIEPSAWAACGNDDTSEPNSWFGGFDLGRSDDFAAIARVGKVGDDDAPGYVARVLTYTCQDRRKELQTAEVQTWIDEGWLVEHPGNQIDLGAIEEDIVSWSTAWPIRNWAFDPTFAMQMSQRLYNDYGIDVFKFNQTVISYNEPLHKFTTAVKAGRVIHTGEACLAWQARNLTIKKNAGDLWMPDKSHPINKIDAMVAVLMAFAGCVFEPVEPDFWVSALE